MTVTEITSKKIELTAEEFSILTKAKKILEDFTDEVCETYADEALSYLTNFLEEDIPDANFIVIVDDKI